MDDYLDSSYILYGLGALLGIFAILYFGGEILLSLSPTVKSLILFTSFVFFLVSSLYLKTDTINTVLTVLSGGAYIVFLGYTVFRFTLSSNQIFVLLAFSSILFVGLGYMIRERGLSLTAQQSKLVLAGCVLVVLILITVDVFGSQASVDATWEDEVDAAQFVDSEVTIGTLQLQNDFIFSRVVDVPRHRICLFAPNQSERITRSAVSDDLSGSTLLSGGETRTTDVTVQFPVVPADVEEEHDRGLTADDYQALGTIPVEHAAQCEESADTAKIVVADGIGSSVEMVRMD